MTHPLAALAEQLTAAAAKNPNGITASIEVRTLAALTVGFEAGDVITPEWLQNALVEQGIEMAKMAEDGSIHSVELLDLRDE